MEKILNRQTSGNIQYKTWMKYRIDKPGGIFSKKHGQNIE